MKKISFLFFLIIPFIVLTNAQTLYNITPKQLKTFQKKYGEIPKKRLILWDKMIQNNKNKSILDKLKNVNDFFNMMKYASDKKHWHKNDYWATPFEFLGTGAGDCEDYAIAKYFSLRKLGIKDEKLRITYVIYKKPGISYSRPHMVLTYYHKLGATPIILDSINKKLKLATKRKDLKPIYSFNASGLWKAKKVGSVRIGVNNLKSWKNLMERN